MSDPNLSDAQHWTPQSDSDSSSTPTAWEGRGPTDRSQALRGHLLRRKRRKPSNTTTSQGQATPSGFWETCTIVHSNHAKRLAKVSLVTLKRGPALLRSPVKE